MNVQLLTQADRGVYLDRIQRDIASAEHFVLVSAFATSDGIELLEPAMRTCLEAGGQGTLVLALDRQHFNAADVFRKLGTLVESFPRLEVRLVLERSGLLHAKAVFAKSPHGDATLLVGSANLTEKAFTQNHELGLWVHLLGRPEVSRTFQRFVQGLGGKPCDARALHELAESMQGLRPPLQRGSGPRGTSWNELFATPASPPSVPIETFVGDWLQLGSIVGRGRRGLDVLVIRTPGEHLEQRGLIKRMARRRIAYATEKTMLSGYNVRLLPDEEDQRLRKDARRTRNTLGKLTLSLPCFGLWMPRRYWDLFQHAAAQIQEEGIPPEAIQQAAERRRRDLDGAGIEREVGAIVTDLQHDGLANPERDRELRAELLAYFREKLTQRTPELIARTVGFRTQRQTLTSDLDLEAVARSFFVDLIQATFAATYRTGVWPRRFRSFVGRTIAEQVANRCLPEVESRDALALRLLDHVTAWENRNIAFETVTAEVNGLIGDAIEFPIMTMEELLQSDQEGDDGGDDD